MCHVPFPGQSVKGESQKGRYNCLCVCVCVCVCGGGGGGGGGVS